MKYEFKPEFTQEQWTENHEDYTREELLELAYTYNNCLERDRYWARVKLNILFEKSGLVGEKPYPNL